MNQSTNHSNKQTNKQTQTNKHTNTQTNKQTSKQANKQTNKQASKQTINHKHITTATTQQHTAHPLGTFTKDRLKHVFPRLDLDMDQQENVCLVLSRTGPRRSPDVFYPRRLFPRRALAMPGLPPRAAKQMRSSRGFRRTDPGGGARWARSETQPAFAAAPVETLDSARSQHEACAICLEALDDCSFNHPCGQGHRFSAERSSGHGSC